MPPWVSSILDAIAAWAPGAATALGSAAATTLSVDAIKARLGEAAAWASQNGNDELARILRLLDTNADLKGAIAQLTSQQSQCIRAIRELHATMTLQHNDIYDRITDRTDWLKEQQDQQLRAAKDEIIGELRDQLRQLPLRQTDTVGSTGKPGPGEISPSQERFSALPAEELRPSLHQSQLNNIASSVSADKLASEWVGSIKDLQRDYKFAEAKGRYLDILRRVGQQNLSPQARVDLYCGLAVCVLNMNPTPDFLREAADFVDQAAQAIPNDKQVWGVRAWIALERKDYEQAGRCVRKALEIMPLYHLGLSILTALQIRAGETPRAILSSLFLDSHGVLKTGFAAEHLASVKMIAAQLHLMANEFDACLSLSRTVAAEYPRDSQARSVVARALMSKGLSQPGRIIDISHERANGNRSILAEAEKTLQEALDISEEQKLLHQHQATFAALATVKLILRPAQERLDELRDLERRGAPISAIGHAEAISFIEVERLGDAISVLKKMTPTSDEDKLTHASRYLAARAPAEALSIFETLDLALLPEAQRIDALDGMMLSAYRVRKLEVLGRALGEARKAFPNAWQTAFGHLLLTVTEHTNTDPKALAALKDVEKKVQGIQEGALRLASLCVELRMGWSTVITVTDTLRTQYAVLSMREKQRYHEARASAYLGTKDYRRVTEELRKAYDHGAATPNVLGCAGVAYGQLGLHAKAVETLTHLCALKEGHTTQNLSILATEYALLGRWEDARCTFEEAARDDSFFSKDVDVTNFAVTLALLGLHSLALDVTSKASDGLWSEPGASIHRLRAQLLRKHGDLGELTTFLARFHKRHPASGWVFAVHSVHAGALLQSRQESLRILLDMHQQGNFPIPALCRVMGLSCTQGLEVTRKRRHRLLMFPGGHEDQERELEWLAARSGQVIVDHVSLLVLTEGDLLEDFIKLFTKVLVPRSVFDQLCTDLIGYESETLRKALNILRTHSRVEIAEVERSTRVPDGCYDACGASVGDCLSLALRTGLLLICSDAAVNGLAWHLEAKCVSSCTALRAYMDKGTLPKEKVAQLLRRLLLDNVSYVPTSISLLLWAAEKDGFKPGETLRPFVEEMYKDESQSSSYGDKLIFLLISMLSIDIIGEAQKAQWAVWIIEIAKGLFFKATRLELLPREARFGKGRSPASDTTDRVCALADNLLANAMATIKFTLRNNLCLRDHLLGLVREHANTPQWIRSFRVLDRKSDEWCQEQLGLR